MHVDIHINIDTTEHRQCGEDLLSTALGYSGYWAKFVRIVQDDSGRVVAVNVGEHERYKLPRAKTITPLDLIRACPTALKDPKLENGYAVRAYAQALFNPKQCDHDQPVADMLLQYAVFGELVYG